MRGDGRRLRRETPRRDKDLPERLRFPLRADPTASPRCSSATAETGPRPERETPIHGTRTLPAAYQMPPYKTPARVRRSPLQAPRRSFSLLRAARSVDRVSPSRKAGISEPEAGPFFRDQGGQGVGKKAYGSTSHDLTPLTDAEIGKKGRFRPERPFLLSSKALRWPGSSSSQTPRPSPSERCSSSSNHRSRKTSHASTRPRSPSSSAPPSPSPRPSSPPS